MKSILNKSACRIEQRGGNDVLLYAVQLTLKGHHNVTSAIDAIDKGLYRDIGGMGFFELYSPLPEHCTTAYVFKDESILETLTPEVTDRINENSCRYMNKGERDGNTRISIIVAVPEYESLNAEYLAQAQDLNVFASTKICIDWIQIEMPEIEEVIQPEPEVIIPVGKPVHVRFFLYGMERHQWTTTMPNATPENLLNEFMGTGIVEEAKSIKYEIRAIGCERLMAKGTLYTAEFE